MKKLTTEALRQDYTLVARIKKHLTKQIKITIKAFNAYNDEKLDIECMDRLLTKKFDKLHTETEKLLGLVEECNKDFVENNNADKVRHEAARTYYSYAFQTLRFALNTFKNQLQNLCDDFNTMDVDIFFNAPLHQGQPLTKLNLICSNLLLHITDTAGKINKINNM